MSKPKFEIDEEFIDKDESRFTYREHEDGTTRVFVGDLPHFTKTVSLGDTTHWDDGAPITDDQRRRLVDRVSTYVFAQGYTSVCDRTGTLRFARGDYEITVSFSGKVPIAWYAEAGRSTCIVGRTVGGDDNQRAHLYFAQTTHWTSGVPITDEERETIASRLAADRRWDVEDPKRPTDPWRLALAVWRWRSCVHAIVAPPPGAWTGPSAPPPADTLFWRVELPTICKGGYIGWDCDVKRSHLGLARIAAGAGVRVRDWLFAEGLPVGAVDLAATNETRLQLLACQSKPPPDEIARCVLGAVVETRCAHATPAFALYADGRARYLDSDCLVAWELPEVAFAEAWLAHLQPQMDGATPGRARQHIDPGEVRVTLLTPSGPYVPKGIDRAFVDACSAFLQRMIETTLPLDL